MIFGRYELRGRSFSVWASRGLDQGIVAQVACLANRLSFQDSNVMCLKTIAGRQLLQNRTQVHQIFQSSSSYSQPLQITRADRLYEEIQGRYDRLSKRHTYNTDKAPLPTNLECRTVPPHQYHSRSPCSKPFI